MSKKNGLPDNWLEANKSVSSPLEKYRLNPIGFQRIPLIKVPLEIQQRLQTIAMVNMMEPWEVIQELLEHRFKESA